MSGIGGIVLPFFTSPQDGFEWSDSRLGPFSPQGKSPRNPLDRKLGGSQFRSRCYGEDKNLATEDSRTPAVQTVDRRYTN
jgi:hypothetical protein